MLENYTPLTRLQIDLTLKNAHPYIYMHFNNYN